ncbi:DNA glycosylase [Podospora appendiculata]|uniref:DNA glycosylase n=1 Tax=Podospora appendiculata TaxID=314037 RepID=A0AAE0WZC9_9PEZI|nr:DNA glycosylase [Podospora appendiculata]
MASRKSARLSARAANATVANLLLPPSPEAVPPSKSRKRKAATDESTPTPSDEAPSTPQKRRVRNKEPNLPPPATPTPSAVGLIATAASLTPTQKPKPAAVNRLADPNKTNAPLFSPQTSRIVASKPIDNDDAPSPSKAPSSQLQPRPTTTTPNPKTTTTANILEEACAHLIAIDPRMKNLIDKNPCRVFSPEGLAEQIDPFEALVSSIISQQVSGAAARAIKSRFIALFDDAAATTGTADTPPKRFPAPSHVCATPLPTLRAAGLSQRKAEYIQGIASKFAQGELSAQMLADAPYEELVAKLTAVRGLGRWSVEMFACFALKRMDVFSLGDLGVQRGMAAFAGRDVARLKTAKGKGGGSAKWKYMSEKEMEEISERFRPYRSLFMWYMWRVEETDVSTLE